jgi:hypothetical protein
MHNVMHESTENYMDYFQVSQLGVTGIFVKLWYNYNSIA